MEKMTQQEKKAIFLVKLAMELKLKKWPKIVAGKGAQWVNGRLR